MTKFNNNKQIALIIELVYVSYWMGTASYYPLIVIFKATILKHSPTLRTGGKKDEKRINVQDGISPYSAENSSKINNSYMYDYLIVKSKVQFWNLTKSHSTYSKIQAL